MGRDNSVTQPDKKRYDVVNIIRILYSKKGWDNYNGSLKTLNVVKGARWYQYPETLDFPDMVHIFSRKMWRNVENLMLEGMLQHDNYPVYDLNNHMSYDVKALKKPDKSFRLVV